MPEVFPLEDDDLPLDLPVEDDEALPLDDVDDDDDDDLPFDDDDDDDDDLPLDLPLEDDDDDESALFPLEDDEDESALFPLEDDEEDDESSSLSPWPSPCRRALAVPSSSSADCGSGVGALWWVGFKVGATVSWSWSGVGAG